MRYTNKLFTINWLTVEGIRSLIKESFAYGFANIVSRFIGFLLMPLYTRILTPEDYGALNVVNITLMLATMFSVLGLDGATHVFYWEKEDIGYRKKVFSTWLWTQVLVCCILIVLFYLVSDTLSILLFSSTEYSALFRISSLILITGILPSIVINWLRVKRKPWSTTWYSLLMSLITIGLNIWFIAYKGWGIQGFFWAQIISGLIMTILGVAIMKDWLLFNFFDISLLKLMLKYSLPMIPTPIAFWVLNFAGSYFIQVLYGESEVGLYQTGSTIASIMLLIVSSFTQAWGPFAMSIKEQKNAKDIYAKVLVLYTVVSGMLASFIGIFSNEILMLMTTTAYLEAHYVTGILVFNSVLTGMNFIAALGLNINKNMKPYSAAIFKGALINLILYYPVILFWGKEGSAVLTLLSSLVVCVWIFYAANKVYPIKYRYVDCILVFTLFITGVGVAKIFSFNYFYENLLFKGLIFFTIAFLVLYFTYKHFINYRSVTANN